jgi:hypothetical protein
MPRYVDLDRSVSAFKGAIFLLLMDLFGALFLWSSLPYTHEYPLHTGVFATLVMYGSTVALFWYAWRVSRGTPWTPVAPIKPESHKPPPPALAVLDDILYSLLAIKAGIFLALIFSKSLTTPGKDQAFGIGAFFVSLVLFVFGIYSYRKRISRPR